MPSEPGPAPILSKITLELDRELNELAVHLERCRQLLDQLGLHAAAADANQALERVRALVRAAEACRLANPPFW